MNRNFRLLLSGQLVSQVGDKFHMIALALWVLDTTGSSAKMGVVLAASLIPSLILGLFSGAFIDRYQRKWIIVGTDLIRGMALLVFAGLIATGVMNFYVIIAVQIVLSINAAFFDPAIPAVIPQLVEKEQLGRANAMHQSVNSFAMIGGAALGGIAVSILGYIWIFVLNGLSFLISAGFESRIKIPGTCEGEDKKSLMSDIRAGYAYLIDSRALLVILFMVMVIHFFVGGIEVFMPVIANTVSGDGPKTLGVFQAALGVGVLTMSLFLSQRSTMGREKTALLSSVMAMGGVQILTCFMAGTDDLAATGYAFCFFIWGCAMIRAAVSFKTLLQTHAGHGFGGRVFAAASTIGNASIPAAMIVFGLLLEYVDHELLLPVSGVALAGLGLISFVLFKEKRNDAQKHRARFQKN